MTEVVVKRYPTKLHIRCPCGHQGYVVVFLDKRPKLVCSKCGDRDALIVTRDRMRSWSNKRRGRK